MMFGNDKKLTEKVGSLEDKVYKMETELKALRSQVSLPPDAFDPAWALGLRYPPPDPLLRDALRALLTHLGLEYKNAGAQIIKKVKP